MTAMTKAALSPARSRFSIPVSALGPGIMVAAAAIGGSHLIASTQAGARFGWQLAGLIILVNLFKYPFFQYGARYGAATGESLVAGYRRLGKGWLRLFLGLNLFSAVINVAALLGLTGALFKGLFPQLQPAVMASVAALVSIFIILRGHYGMVDNVTKWIVALLALLTVIATVLAFMNPADVSPGYVAPSPWTMASLGMLISLMGWMPAPVEVSAMNSVWSRNKFLKQGRPDMKLALLDLNIGYLGTAILALMFLSLGANMMHGTGIELARSGAAFSIQLADMYSTVMGEWSRWLMMLAAICCIYSSALTCVDGYSRVNKSALENLKGNDTADTESPMLVLVSTAASMILLVMFPGSMMAMLKFAMIAAFLTTPLFALLNYLLINAEHVPAEYRPGKALTLLSQAGLVFLAGFALLFIWWQWLM